MSIIFKNISKTFQEHRVKHRLVVQNNVCRISDIFTFLRFYDIRGRKLLKFYRRIECYS